MSNFQSPMGKPASGLISPDTAAHYGLAGRIEALGLILIDLHRSSPPASSDTSPTC